MSHRLKLPLTLCRRHKGILYPLADWQSAGVLVVLSHATRIDQWLKSPLAKTTINLGRSREPAKVLRTERAGLERNKPLRYSAAGAPGGANAVKPEHLRPPEISRRLSTGAAVI